MYALKRILYTTDFTPHSLYAFSLARDLARQNRADVLLLHVARPPGPEDISYGEATTMPEPEGYYQRLLAEMRATFEPQAGGVPLQFLIMEGDPVEQIDRVARERQCDLIVIGTHSLSAWERLFSTSTAEHLMRTASCPVLTVRMPAGAKVPADPVVVGAARSDGV
jgi:nucleotide-binding universal stress UspA family protein